MQGEDPANARARQLLDSCSRTITVTRIQAGDGVNAFRAETSAFPELNASGAAVAAVALPAASDEFPTPFFNDGIKVPENFNVDGGEGGKKTCGVCFNDLLGDELGEALAVGQSVTLRQLMCTQLQPGTGAMQLAAWAGGGHYFPHVYHGPCIEECFRTKLQQHHPPDCPLCKAEFSNHHQSEEQIEALEQEQVDALAQGGPIPLEIQLRLLRSYYNVHYGGRRGVRDN